MTSPSQDRLFGTNSSMAIKVPCRVATTANITLSGEQTIDGVAVVANDRVLVKDQTDGTENGIYIADTSEWQRAPDFDGTRDVTAGTLVYVNGGTLGTGFWYVTTTGTIVVGTTSIAFGKASSVLAVVSAFMQTMLNDATAAEARTTLGAAGSGAVTSSGLTMATSRLLGRTTAGTGAVEEISVGSNLTLSGGTLSATQTLFPGIQQGLVLSNNGSDATNDIDIASGKAVDSTGAVVMSLASAMTKRLDANWAAGTNQGGRYSGAAIANTTYHVWLVAKAGGADVDVYLAPSATAATVLGWLQAETGGADYLYLWRIGAILRESAAIVAFSQFGDEFLRSTTVLDVNATNPGTSAVDRTLSVPTGVKVYAIFNALAASVTISSGVIFSSKDVTDAAPSTTVAPLANSGGTGSTNTYGIYSIRTDTSAVIRSRFVASDGNTVLRIATVGWRDPSIMKG